MIAGFEGIPLPVTVVFIQGQTNWYEGEELSSFIAFVFLAFTFIFAFIAYILHQLCKAEYKWW